MSEVEKILEREHREMLGMYDVLWQDVVELGKRCETANPLGHERRTFVRAAFAFIEGLAYRVESYSHLVRLIRKEELSPSEIEAFKNNFALRGPKTEFKVKHPSFILRAKNSLKAVSKLVGSNFDMSLQSQDLEELSQAAKIRDRITHPKKIDDLILMDAEIILVMKATAWYHNSFAYAATRPRLALLNSNE